MARRFEYVPDAKRVRPLGQVGVLRIYPCFAPEIFHGIKCVEFRKQRFIPSTTHALVYETEPVNAFTGWFAIAGQVSAPPGELWERFCNEGCVSRPWFDDYYAGCSVGVAILITDVRKFAKPLSPLGLGVSDRALRTGMVFDNRVVRKVLTSPCAKQGEAA